MTLTLSPNPMRSTDYGPTTVSSKTLLSASVNVSNARNGDMRRHYIVVACRLQPRSDTAS